jgi:tetratricopeptide (TPR) repeat protein
MTWKEQLRILEQQDDFDVALFFMEKIIQEYPDDVDAYIFMLFRLMDTIVEYACHFANVSKTPVSDIKKEYYDAKEAHYEVLAKKYFKSGYAKFSENASFLFCVGITAVMSEWYFGIDIKDYENMLEKAMQLEPDNLVDKRTYYIHLNQSIPEKKEEAIAYASLILQDNSPLVQSIKTRGAFGEYLLDCMRGWAERTCQF